MEKFLDLISGEMKRGFSLAGYDEELGKVTVSNRPDLCEYQCNGAMAGAKKYHKAPIAIAGEVAEKLADSEVFEEVCAAAPGFLNLKLKNSFVRDYVAQMAETEKFGLTLPEKPKTIVVDYGGPNVAKPLHVGHLRSAVIGESIKRICRYNGHRVIGDVHLGDWGLQMGLIITELRERQPELVYFDEAYEGEYPAEAPFTVSELEEIYPAASGKSKADPDYKEAALQATLELQRGRRGYRALWRHIMDVSVADLKKNYASLDVEFDLWKGESDVSPLIPGLVERLKEQGLAHESEGALVVDVKEETDTKEIPPCIILKSDGAALYATTDLATIQDRVENLHADELIYLTDKRQEMHFLQVFRVARKAGIVKPETQMRHIGFGTMNGKDGKPFKTREGGVMRLEYLVRDIEEEMYRKVVESRQDISEEEARKTAKIIGLSALKYGYTIVRIKSILNRYREMGGELSGLAFLDPENAPQKELMMQLAGFNAMMENAGQETAPHKVCAYIYDLANAFNKFYHETKIISEEDPGRKGSWIALLILTRDVLETCIGVLGFSAPDRM